MCQLERPTQNGRIARSLAELSMGISPLSRNAFRDGDMVLHHFFGSRMVLQLPVNLIRKTLPTVFAEYAVKLVLAQLMQLFTTRQPLKILFQFSAGSLGLPGNSSDTLYFRLRRCCISLGETAFDSSISSLPTRITAAA